MKVGQYDDNYFKKVFSKNLSRICSEKGITQTDLARALNISKSTISSWFVGERLPRMGKVEMLADYLGVLKTDLLEEKPTEPVPAEVSDDDIKFALFGGADDITDAQFEEVKAFARFVRERDKNEKDKKD